MIPVFQRIIGDNRGDCLTACVASILELPYEDVPAWLALSVDNGNPHDWHSWFTAWLRVRGFHYLTIDFDALNDWRGLVGAYCIASMKSQLFPGGRHAVVGSWERHEDGSHQFIVVHDPNFQNVPYVPAIPLEVSFLVPLSPSVPPRKPTVEWDELMDYEYGAHPHQPQTAAQALTPEQRKELADLAHISPRI